MTRRYYEVQPRDLGGWRLFLYEDDVEMGGGVFPEAAYGEALAEGAAWAQQYTDYHLDNPYGQWTLYRYSPDTEENRVLGKHPTLEEALDAIAGDDTELPARVTFSTGNMTWESFER